MSSKKRKMRMYDKTHLVEAAQTHRYPLKTKQPFDHQIFGGASVRRASRVHSITSDHAVCPSFEGMLDFERFNRIGKLATVTTGGHHNNSDTVVTSSHRAVQNRVSGLFFERARVRAWYNGESSTLPAIIPGVLDASTTEVVDEQPNRLQKRRSGYGESKMGDLERGHTEMGSPLSQRLQDDRNDNVYNERELADMDLNMTFVIPSETRIEKIKHEAVRAMASASESMKPCGICELSCLRSDITSKVLTNEFIKAMKHCLIVHPASNISDVVREEYNVSDVDFRLEGLLLCRSAIVMEATTVRMDVCSVCLRYVEVQKHAVPPCFAIANGNYLGKLPSKFNATTRTDEQAVALVLPCVSLSVVTGGACKTIKSHHYVVRNTEGAIIEMLPRDLSSRVRVTMVGCMTTAQAAACKKRYELNLPLCEELLQFLKTHNSEYQRSRASDESSTVLTQATRTSVIIDCANVSGQDPQNDDLARIIRDDSTYSTFGSAVEEGTLRSVEDTWIGGSSFLRPPQQQHLSDILVKKSNAYVDLTKWAVCVQMFPTLFPYGCGGPTEPRQKAMSFRRWLLRCLKVDGHRFESHYAFMLLAFDFLASQKARETMYVKMNIKRQAIKAAEIPSSTIRQAIKYFNHMTACRAKGIKPRPPPPDVQRVIDLRKGLHIPESDFYGSNAGRMRARHHLFGMLKRFGPLQVFFTVSPDSAGTYNIAVKIGRVTEKVIEEVNLALLPNRAERKSIASAHPVECARYFLRVMNTVIEVLLGWDVKAHAPKRGGGIFGVVRAFGAAAETQVAGDLHAHIAVWLHGFPTTSTGYRDTIENNAEFRDRVVEFADSVLCTKPPCIQDELQCPGCSVQGSLIPVVPGLDAFRRPAHGTTPPTTSCCNACDRVFGDKDIIELSIQRLAGPQHFQINSQLTDFEKCRPPPKEDAGVLATSLLVRDVQVHYWNHCKSCFKNTIRTPKASVCRFFKPENAVLGPTTIVDGSRLLLHRAIGCEYVNAYNPVVMSSLKCNHDAQFVFGGSKDTAAYVAKYCFKNQNPVENHAALSLAAFSKAAKKADQLPPETTPMERGCKILGSMLYSITNGQEVAATMAALYILNETPFWFSHEFVHINLWDLLKSQKDSVEIAISQQISENQHSNIPNVVAESVLERYWKRQRSLKNTSFIEICEKYEYTGRQKTGGSQFQSVCFSRLASAKVLVLCGEDIPDITTQLPKEKLDYYYTALLTLFKPHRQATLLPENQTPLAGYRSFLQFGDIDQVGLLKNYEQTWFDYYKAQRNSNNGEESPEEELVRTRAPATSSSVPDVVLADNIPNDDTYDPLPDDIHGDSMIDVPDISTTKLALDAIITVGYVENVAAVIMSAARKYKVTRSIALPDDFRRDLYQSQIIKPLDDDENFGTLQFLESFNTMQTRLERISECYRPVPHEPDIQEPRWAPDTLPSFPTIEMTSEAFKLNFWQHVMFEMCARHLLYSYASDIEDAAGESNFFPQDGASLYDIKPQLIGYLGGQGGTGKSMVVEALLTMARKWGREGSVETMSFTGAAAINVHGKTMHSARNLQLNGADPKSAPSSEMKARFSRVVLVIVDEISISPQALLGGMDSVSRSMSASPQKFMGGRHVLLIGDFLQLPPVGGVPCYQVPSSSANRLCHAGYAIYSAINFVVFLTKNMRARLDHVYANILDNLRWGRVSDENLDILNSRVHPVDHEEVSLSRTSDEFHRPIVVCTNKLRCAINHLMTFKVAQSRKVTVYECMATSSARSKTIVSHLANATDDVTNRVPMKLLFYFGMPVMVTRKHPELLDADIIANGVMGTIVGMHPPPNELATTQYTVNGAEIHRLLQRPELLLIKLHGCCKPLITGFPDGVIGLPPLHASLQLKRIPNLSQASITVDQFAVVPAFACTTEKLQGQTCHDGVVVTPIDRRAGTPKQSLYVALSRATCLEGLILTEKITRAYLDKFRPSQTTVNEILRLIRLVGLPPYASPEQVSEFNQWKSEQRS